MQLLPNNGEEQQFVDQRVRWDGVSEVGGHGLARPGSVALPEPLGDERPLPPGQRRQPRLHQVLGGAGGHGADGGGGRAGHEAPSAPALWGQGLHPLPGVPWCGGPPVLT